MRLIDRLRKEGFEVVAFDAYHHRVNGEFDFWLNDHGNPYQWHHRPSGRRGAVRRDCLVKQINTFLKEELPQVSKEEFVRRLVEIGWSAKEADKEWNDRNSTAKS